MFDRIKTLSIESIFTCASFSTVAPYFPIFSKALFRDFEQTVATNAACDMQKCLLSNLF